MKGSCATCVRIVAISMVWLLGMNSYSFGQFLPGGQPGGIGQPGLFQAPGQNQPAPVFGGQGDPAQIPQIPPVGIPGQVPQNNFPVYRSGSLVGLNSGFGNGNSNGQTTVVTGLGALELGAAQGNVLNQQATGIYLNNYKLAVSTYYDVKRIHDNARVEHQRIPSTREQLDSTAKATAPHRLNKDEFDAATGKINWPEVLSTSSFAEHRTTLEKLFAERAGGAGGRGTSNFHAIHAATTEMQNRLQSMASSLVPHEYLMGHKFIASLAHEGATIPHPGAVVTK